MFKKVCIEKKDKKKVSWVALLTTTKVTYKLTLSLLMGMIKHSQNTQINKFTIYLQYLAKEVSEGVHFLNLDKHQTFYKLVLF